jgi:hypothetical protein
MRWRLSSWVRWISWKSHSMTRYCCPGGKNAAAGRATAPAMASRQRVGSMLAQLTEREGSDAADLAGQAEQADCRGVHQHETVKYTVPAYSRKWASSRRWSWPACWP